MSVPPIIQYPLDLTGTSPTNAISRERREITNKTERVFVPKAGPFYTDSFVIYNAETGLPLKPVDDYVLAQPFAQASLRSGKDVQCAVVLKTETPISVEMDYQVVGGEYSWNLTALADLIIELDLDDRPIKWGSVLGRPTMYPPAPHLHDIGDTYGWEYVVWQLERVTYAILTGDEASHEELRQQMQALHNLQQAIIDALDARFVSHTEDKGNPHEVTKAQTGLGDVDNFPTATSAESVAGTAVNRFMTPAGSSLLADRIATERVAEHNADKGNPHQVTKAQVGLGNVDDYATATQAQAESATVTDKFMTPQRTYQAIMIHAGVMLEAHVSNKQNPHAVTKAQVGLGNVDNYGTATQEEAVAGVASNKFMTPLRVKESIDFHAGTLLNAHVQDTSNPHRVTKAQVGLGNLPNAVTRERTLNSDTTLLLAGAMRDHLLSTDHDNRYVRLNTNQNTSLRVVNGTLQSYVGGYWRQIWPAVWSNHVAQGYNDPYLGEYTGVQLLSAGGRLYATVDGQWRQIWPTQWAD